jgi:ribonuclease-3
MKVENSSKFENNIHYHFKNKALLKQALTHSSYANEQKINKTDDYERIEFLGDAVLELISSEFIYKLYPTMGEGEMTKLRSTYVCETALAYCARQLKLDRYIFLGKGEEITGGRSRDSILSDVCEAVIGAIYLDGGFDAAKNHIHTYILKDLEDKQLFFDSKTLLQEIIQGEGDESLHYVCVKEEGPDHDKKFFVEARLADETIIGMGTGKTKKAAEQQAAYKAIKNKSKNQDK